MKNVITQNITEHIDYDTGEHKSTYINSTYKLDAEPPFVKVYLEHIIYLNNLPKGSSAILSALMRSINYEGKLIITGYVKKEIAKKLNLKNVSSISNSITMFVKKDILRRIGTGAYVTNPFYFARGKWEDISRLRAEYLKINITYNEDGSFNINDGHFKLNNEEDINGRAKTS
jgi:hypothetical protein